MSEYKIIDEVRIVVKFKDDTIRRGKLHTSEIILSSDDWNGGIQINNVKWDCPKPTKVIFNPPATIVFWNDGDKTVVKIQDEQTKENLVVRGGIKNSIVGEIPICEYGTEIFDKEKGLAMCFAKKMMGNKGSYYDMFKEWCE